MTRLIFRGLVVSNWQIGREKSHSSSSKSLHDLFFSSLMLLFLLFSFYWFLQRERLCSFSAFLVSLSVFLPDQLFSVVSQYFFRPYIDVSNSPLRGRDSTISSSVQELEASAERDMEKMSQLENMTAQKNQQIDQLRRAIDDIPTRAELSQYEKRFSELYEQVWAFFHRLFFSYVYACLLLCSYAFSSLSPPFSPFLLYFRLVCVFLLDSIPTYHPQTFFPF